MSSTSLAGSEWLRGLSERQPVAAELLARSAEEQHRRGYFHTIREICQEPSTLVRTSDLMLGQAANFESLLAGIGNLTLTGSVSSEYAGDCVRLTLQRELGIVTQAIGGRVLLAHGNTAFPPERPALVISIARSGDSPESVGALAFMLKTQPQIRHLVITCNAAGSLARTYP